MGEWERHGRRGALLRTLMLVVLVGLALRAPVTAVAPLLAEIRTDLGQSTSFAGLLTTLPVLCLGVFAFAAGRLRQRFGDERTLLGCLLVLVVGNALRGLGTVPTLLGGTIVVGSGIAVANVALPGLIKRDFAHRLPGVTALYTACLTLGGAGAAASMVPVARATGVSWQVMLGSLAMPVVLALVVTISVLAANRKRASLAAPVPTTAHGRGRMWRSALTWQVTVFMGMQSLLAYVVFGWLPTMATGRGFSPESAGLLLGVQAAVQAMGSIAVPVLCRRLPDQRWLAAGLAGVIAIGFTGIVLAPAPTGVWVAALGLGLAQGAGFGLALTLFGLRSPDAETATQLSGTAQGIGYLLAAIGPLAVGVLFELAGNWQVPLLFLLGCCAVMATSGLLAGRAVQLDSVRAEPANPR